MKSNQSAFSLIELIVVISIIGILAAIGLPSLLNYLKFTKLQTTVTMIQQFTKQSKFDALTDSGIKTVCVTQEKVGLSENNDCNNVSSWSQLPGISLDTANSTFSNKNKSVSGKGSDPYKISFSGMVNGGQLGRLTFTTRTANEPLTNRNTMCLFQTLKNVDNLGYGTNIDIRKGKDCQKS